MYNHYKCCTKVVDEIQAQLHADWSNEQNDPSVIAICFGQLLIKQNDPI